MAVFLYRYAKYKNYDLSYDNEALNVFTDSNSVSDYALIPMMWAIKQGLITGISETTIAPQGQASRAQCAAIFMRFVSFME